MRWSYAAPAALVAVVAPAHAVTYLSAEQAAALLFPQAASQAEQVVLLSDEQRRAIAQAGGQRVREARVTLRTARDAEGRVLGRVVVDEVTGKHDLITYAVGIDAAGRVVGVEILDYRENYGGEIRQAGWRSQFRGKARGDVLRVGDDIANISGATLSCNHVTDGVRRILATNDLVLKTLPA